MLKSKRVGYALFFLIFLFMLLCNSMTDLFTDDFSYLYNFQNGERITGVFQIFGSMHAHAISKNGRLCAHFLTQLFLLLPKWIFNITNALVFASMILLMHKIACQKQTNAMVLLGIFSSVWILSPVFGQVYLWLDGACNYLWAYFLGILFILPYINNFVHNTTITKLFPKLAFLLLALVMGAYSENTSAGFICIAVLLLFAERVFFKKKLKIYEILGVILSILGYMTIYLSPAQWSNKAAAMSLYTLRLNFIRSLEMYKTFTPVLIVFAIALTIAIYRKVNIKSIVLSLLFLAGSLLSNFMMIIASYYEQRSSVSGFILLLIATFILLGEILHTSDKMLVYCLLSAVLLCSTYHLCIGVNDIYVTHTKVEHNEQIILESKQNGDLDIEVPMFAPETKYSAVYKLRYLSAQTAYTWPNTSMARYYGVHSIVGKW